MDTTVGNRAFVRRHAFAQLLFWSGLYYVFPALVPEIVRSTGWHPLRISAALTAGFLLWAAFSPVAGIWIDRGHGARMMRLAGLAGALLLAALAMTSSEVWAAILLVAIGLPEAMLLYDPCFAILLRRFGPGEAGGGAVTAVTLIAGFATLATFPPVAGMLQAGIGWRWIVMVFALALLVGVGLVPGEGRASRSSAVEKTRFAMPGIRLIVLGLAFAFVIFAHAVLLFQVPTLLSGNWPGRESLLLPMLLGPSQVGGRLIWNAARRRVRSGPAVVFVFAALFLPPLLLLASRGAPALGILALVLQGAGFGVQTTLRPALALDWLPAGAVGLQFGWIAMIGLVFMALGPLAGSAAAHLGGFAGVMQLVMGAEAVALFLILGLAYRVHRGWSLA